MFRNQAFMFRNQAFCTSKDIIRCSYLVALSQSCPKVVANLSQSVVPKCPKASHALRCMHLASPEQVYPQNRCSTSSIVSQSFRHILSLSGVPAYLAQQLSLMVMCPFEVGVSWPPACAWCLGSVLCMFRPWLGLPRAKSSESVFWWLFLWCWNPGQHFPGPTEQLPWQSSLLLRCPRCLCDLLSIAAWLLCGLLTCQDASRFYQQDYQFGRQGQPLITWLWIQNLWRSKS